MLESTSLILQTDDLGLWKTIKRASAIANYKLGYS